MSIIEMLAYASKLTGWQWAESMLNIWISCHAFACSCISTIKKPVGGWNLLLPSIFNNVFITSTTALVICSVDRRFNLKHRVLLYMSSECVNRLCTARINKKEDDISTNHTNQITLNSNTCNYFRYTNRVYVKGIIHLKIKYAVFHSEWCRLALWIVISCLDSHSDGTHSRMLYICITAL